MDLPDDIFVLVAEYDASENTREKSPEYGYHPIVMEAPLCNTTREAALKMAAKWSKLGYGEIKIGRVLFSDIDQVNPRAAASDLLLSDNKKLDELLDSLSAGEWQSMGPEVRSHLRLKVLEWIRNL